MREDSDQVPRFTNINRRRFLASSALGVHGIGIFTGTANAQQSTITISQEGTSFQVTPLNYEGQNVEQFYSYDNPDALSANTPTGLESSDTTRVFFYSGPRGISLVVIHDQVQDGDGGEVRFEFDGLSAGRWVVQDDPEDTSYDTNAVTWNWAPCCTDGGALRGVSGQRFTLRPEFRSGIDTFEFLSGDPRNPDVKELSLTEPIQIEGGTARVEIAETKPVQSVFNTGLSNNFDLVADKKTAVLVYFKETDALEDLTEPVELSISGPVVVSESKVVDASTIRDTATTSEDRDDSEDFVAIQTQAVGSSETGDIEITVSPNQDGFRESTTTQAAKVWETDGISLEHYNMQIDSGGDSIDPLPTNVFNEHVDMSDEFILGTYPVPESSFNSNREQFTTRVDPVAPSLKIVEIRRSTILNDIEQKRQRSDTSPDFGIGVSNEELFDFVGLSSGGYTEAGTSKESVIITVDFPVATAHEIGHQFGLYVNQEEYDNHFDETEGYWVNKNRYVGANRDVGSFMTRATGNVRDRWMENEPCDWEAGGKLIGDGQLFVHPQKDQADYDVIFNELTSADANSDSTSSSQRASNSSVSVTQTTTDANTESIVYIKGVISESDEFFPQRWYYYEDLGPTDTNDGDYTIVMKDDDDATVIEKPFTASFRLLTSTEGIIPQDVAGISFAAKYPETARTVEVTRDETTLDTFDLTVKLLRDGINSIPADGLKSPGKSDVAEQRRNALLNKVDAIENQLDAGNVRGAVQKLQNDLRPKIKRWIEDEYEVNEPFQITRAELINIVNDQINRLKNSM